MKDAVAAFLLIVSSSTTWCQIYEAGVVVETFAGSGYYGHVDGVGLETMFYNPYDIKVDGWTNFFVTDSGNRAIRQITADRTVSTFVTNLPVAGRFAIDTNRNFWLAANTLMFLSSNGVIRESFALPTQNDFLPAEAGLAVNSKGELYVSIPYSHRIYRFNTNGQSWEVFVGSGNQGYGDGRGIFTAFSYPGSLVFDPADNLYVADTGNAVIRKVTPDRVVTTYAGQAGASSYRDVDSSEPLTNAQFQYLAGLATDRAGNLYVAEQYRVRRVSLQTGVTTMAGGTSAGYRDGSGPSALFRGVFNLCVGPDGALYAADFENHRIRRIVASGTPTGSPARLSINCYAGLRIEGTAGRTYQIEGSTTGFDWMPIERVAIPYSPYLWFDLASTNRAVRFYRAVLIQ